MVINVLPTHLRKKIRQLQPDVLARLEELRLRQNRPLVVGLSDGDVFLQREGGLTKSPERAYIVDADDIQRTTQLVSNSSVYALEEELKNGYITIPGGHRVGITGKVVAEHGRVKTIKYISGFNIRISRQVLGAADEVLKDLISPQGEVYHTMLISPPRCGKTTLLRDIVRQLSNGIPGLNFPGTTVAVVDERSEIAGCHRGIPQQDVGVRTDVLDACPKAEGMMMLLRSMSPRVIATDEIGRMEDVEALEEVLNAGVKVLTTVHGSSLEELKRRPAIQKLLKLQVIERLVFLDRSRGAGTIKMVMDGITYRPLGVKRC
uniref:stage III sporulation protein AA n=1 Tax=Desulforadius tongensis TaxID=1216062 RepID=UPI00195D80D0|nr:stage III sporulation protein AA [Desulforadius tongensis]